MINFASLFNQFRSSVNNVVNDLLDEDNVPLSKLIDEDSFMNEYKSGNNKLIEYMTYGKVKQMIQYVTVLGEGDDKKRNFKFPLTASEVLSADIPSIQDFLLPEGKLYETVNVTVQELVQVEEEQEKKAQKEQQKLQQQSATNDRQEQELNNLIQQSEKEKQQQQTVNEQPKTIISDSLEQVVPNNGDTSVESKQNNAEENVVQQPVEEATPVESVAQSCRRQSDQQAQQESSAKTESKVPRKKVQRVQLVQRVQKLQVPPLITLLLSYFNQQVTYILTGYVCKILTSLFNKRTNQMMEFLFTKNNVYKLVAHIESRSVGEFLLKVLTHESSKFASQRAALFTFLVNKLSQNDSIHVLSNFSSFICETIVKAADNTKTNSPIQEFTQIFFTPQVVTIAIKNVMSDFENVSIYNAPILLTYLTNVPFTLPKNEVVIQQFKLLLGMFIDKSLQKLTVKRSERPRLGFGRIKIIEILSYILKENLIGSRQMFASEPNAFSILFQLCQNYEMNNVLHNEVVKLVGLTFSDKVLSEALLVNNVLLNFLLTESLQDVQIRKGKGKQKYRKGFIGHIVQIARLVQENAAKGNQAAIKILQSQDFDKVLTTLVQKQVSQGNKNLGGFSLKRQLKSQIMFQKQEIISHYIDFLTHSPKPVFEPEPVHVNIQHPDYLEEMERQLEENLAIEELPETKNQLEVEKHEASSQTPPLVQTIVTTEIKVEINFFKSHLDYDVQKLMVDL